MKCCFQITYRAQFGETICLVGKADSDQPEWDESFPLELHCTNEDFWHKDIEFAAPSGKLQYRYALRKTDGRFVYESGDCHCFTWGTSAEGLDSIQHYIVRDCWRNVSEEKVFCSTAFTHSIFARKDRQHPADVHEASKPSLTNDQSSTQPTSRSGRHIRFSMMLPEVSPEQGVAVGGNIPELGQWDLQKALFLNDNCFPFWEKDLWIDRSIQHIEYKYFIYELSTLRVIDFEAGDNRRFSMKETEAEDTLFICSDNNFRRTRPHWRGAGVAIPVFSLRSKDDFGIGEFLDLKKMVDWAVQTGQKIIQILPINDTAIHHDNRDSYPYNTLSVFALNPIYLNIKRVGKFSQKGQYEQYKQRQTELNASATVDYQTVADEKTAYLKQLYRQKGKACLRSKEFQHFFEKNSDWLVPYASFRCQQDEELTFYYFLQFHLDKQLSEVKDYAHRNGVAIKGDVPIGISPDSVDAWTNPELFHRDMQTGAPPDDFSLIGQNWGFPTYHWEEMANDHYQWWTKRFRKMADYFDAYRIDHILGFFRIWEIPQDQPWGLCGRFSPALPYTLDELRERGIDLDEDRLLKPYINERSLQHYFGERASYIEQTYFTRDNSLFRFKSMFDSPRKIETYFQNGASDIDSDKEKLLQLHCEVLFLRDLRNENLFHPRICLYKTQNFKQLDSNTQARLSALYDEFFYHRHNDFWRKSALRKLPGLIAATDMMVCGEDLGMVPDCVPEVMKELSILSLEVQRMPKAAFTEFGDPAQAPYLSVCTTGTHDTNPLRAWWMEDREKTGRYYRRFIAGNSDTIDAGNESSMNSAPIFCDENIVRQIIRQHLHSPALWVILPWQDWIALDNRLALPDFNAERINVPDNPNNLWCYRMHIGLEELLQEKSFNEKLRAMIVEAGR